MTSPRIRGDTFGSNANWPEIAASLSVGTKRVTSRWLAPHYNRTLGQESTAEARFYGFSRCFLAFRPLTIVQYNQSIASILGANRGSSQPSEGCLGASLGANTSWIYWIERLYWIGFEAGKPEKGGGHGCLASEAIPVGREL